MCLKDRLNPKRLASLVNPPTGLTFAEIGRSYDVTRQRIHQLYKEYKELYPDLFIEKEEKVPKKEHIEKMLAQNISLTKMSKEFDITQNKLKKVMNLYGLKKVYLKDKITKEMLYNLYVVQGLSDKEIADRYNCSKNTIEALRKKHEIKKQRIKEG